MLVINTVNSAGGGGGVSKALWSRYGNRLSHRAVFPLYAKHVVIICLLRSLVNLMSIGTATLIVYLLAR